MNAVARALALITINPLAGCDEATIKHMSAEDVCDVLVDTPIYLLPPEAVQAIRQLSDAHLLVLARRLRTHRLMEPDDLNVD